MEDESFASRSPQGRFLIWPPGARGHSAQQQLMMTTAILARAMLSRRHCPWMANVRPSLSDGQT